VTINGGIRKRGSANARNYHLGIAEALSTNVAGNRLDGAKARQSERKGRAAAERFANLGTGSGGRGESRR